MYPYRYLALWLLVLKHGILDLGIRAHETDQNHRPVESDIFAEVDPSDPRFQNLQKLSECTLDDDATVDSSTTPLTTTTTESLDSDTSSSSSATSSQPTSTKTKVNDTSKYQVKKLRNYDSFYVYVFADDAKCCELKYEDDVVWQYDPSKYGTKYPKRLFFHDQGSVLFVNFGNRYLGYVYNTQAASWQLKYDKTDTKGLKQLLLSEGSVEVTAAATEDNDKLLESSEDNQQNDNKDLEQVLSLIKDLVSDKLPTSSSSCVGTETGDGTEVVAQAHKAIQTTRCVDVGVHTSAAEKQVSEKKQPAHSDTKNSHELNMEYSQGKVIKVSYNSEPIWQHEAKNPLPQGITYLSDVMLFFVNFSKTEFYVYKFDGFGWYQAQQYNDAVRSILLDRNSTDEYYYSSQDYVDTYLPKGKQLFNKVYFMKGITSDWLKWLTCFISCCQSELVVYETQVPADYVTKVVVNRFGWYKAQVDVTIHQLKGCELTFSRQGRNKPFGKTRWSETTSTLPKFLVVETLDTSTSSSTSHSESSKISVNDSSKFGIYKFVATDKADSPNRGIYKYLIVFYKSSKCIGIKYRDKSVWKTENNSNSPTKIIIDLKSFYYYFDFDDQTYLKIHDQSLSNIFNI